MKKTKIKNLMGLKGMDKYFEGNSLDDCLQKMAVDIWVCGAEISTGVIDARTEIPSLYEMLKDDEGETWELVK
jgi:hypothetical protein